MYVRINYFLTTPDIRYVCYLYTSCIMHYNSWINATDKQHEIINSTEHKLAATVLYF